MVEGAGAVGVAALLGGQVDAGARAARRSRCSRGGNVDAGLLAAIARRHETEAGRRLVLLTRVPDRPGSARAAARAASPSTGANLVDVAHVREGVDLHVRETAVELVLETRGAEHAERVVATLRRRGLRRRRSCTERVRRRADLLPRSAGVPRRGWRRHHDDGDRVRGRLLEDAHGQALAPLGRRRRARRCASAGSTAQGRSIDDERHMQRFTPRKSRRWSAVNVALVAELEAEGRMTEAGRRRVRRTRHDRGAVLDVEAAQPAAARVRRAPAPRPPEGGRVLGLHAAELPQDARLLDQRGEAPRDARAALRRARRGLRAPASA